MEQIVEGLRQSRESEVDRALAFLSVRYRPHRSGYACNRIARALKKAPLDEDRRELLRRILLDRVTWPWASATSLWHWIPQLRTPSFDAALRKLAEGDVPWLRDRAGLIVRRYL